MTWLGRTGLKVALAATLIVGCGGDGDNENETTPDGGSPNLGGSGGTGGSPGAGGSGGGSAVGEPIKVGATAALQFTATSTSLAESDLELVQIVWEGMARDGSWLPPRDAMPRIWVPNRRWIFRTASDQRYFTVTESGPEQLRLTHWDDLPQVSQDATRDMLNGYTTLNIGTLPKLADLIGLLESTCSLTWQDNKEFRTRLILEISDRAIAQSDLRQNSASSMAGLALVFDLGADGSVSNAVCR